MTRGIILLISVFLAIIGLFNLGEKKEMYGKITNKKEVEFIKDSDWRGYYILHVLYNNNTSEEVNVDYYTYRMADIGGSYIKTYTKWSRGFIAMTIISSIMILINLMIPHDL